MSIQPDPHAELGVPPNATAAEVHHAFRRRLREHHPDTRPRHDDTTDSASDHASDQALQRVLAAYETLRHHAASDPVEAPVEVEPHRPDQQAPGVPSGSLGDPPLKVTAVQWVRAAGTVPSHYPALDQTSHGVPWPDWLIRWMLGQ